MLRVSELLDRLMEERTYVLDDPLDQPDEPKAPEMSTEDLIAALRNVQAAIASGDDLQPPARIRHLHTIDQAIAKLRR